MCQARSETDQETEQSCGSPLTSLFPCSTPVIQHWYQHSTPWLLSISETHQSPLKPGAMEEWPQSDSSFNLNADAGLTNCLLWRLVQKNEMNHHLRWDTHLVLISQHQHPLKSRAVQVFADQQIRARPSEQVSGERFFLLAQSVPALCASVPAFCGSSLL